MMGEPEGNIIKRAFEIAPECGSIQDVKRRLIREGYLHVDAHLAGSQIRRDIGCRLNSQLKHDVPKRIGASGMKKTARPWRDESEPFSNAP